MEHIKQVVEILIYPAQEIHSKSKCKERAAWFLFPELSMIFLVFKCKPKKYDEDENRRKKQQIFIYIYTYTHIYTYYFGSINQSRKRRFLQTLLKLKIWTIHLKFSILLHQFIIDLHVHNNTHTHREKKEIEWNGVKTT